MVNIPIKCAGPPPVNWTAWGHLSSCGIADVARGELQLFDFDRVSSYGEYTVNNYCLGHGRSPGSESPLGRESGHLYTCFLGLEINGS
ncbi:hypothetical protein Asppvi_004133 [Aspergillus pseudoviridinutans]|uniref:Uncharacterized protein n=1 Tax=Aspergillus pseudoviridinutans TaxID=1517512 RepID=A0A9P3B5Y9_9EURO|nr:uncharacterized protein Asppvi_004133 [Aspergillus pseudoviridinutans]GIJ85277.1 hypothetical protein Asppvi_004133 [Aspergillus pseudoviridinutans]